MSAEGAKRQNRNHPRSSATKEKLPVDLGERESEEAQPQTGVKAQ
jgi:hypothetical protein